MALSLPSLPHKRRSRTNDKERDLADRNRQTYLYNIDDADLEQMVKATGETPARIIRELVHEMMQQLRAGDGTDVKLNRSVILAQERITRNGTQPLVAKVEALRTDVKESLISFRETANIVDNKVTAIEERLAQLEETQTGSLRRIAEACAVILGILRHYVFFHFARMLTEQERVSGAAAPTFEKLESGYLKWVERLRERARENDLLGEVRFKEVMAQTADEMRALSRPVVPEGAAPTSPKS